MGVSRGPWRGGLLAREDHVRLIQPGDVLLYRPSDLYGRIIAYKTWHSVAHVEVSVGLGCAVAARPKTGVDRYPLRLDATLSAVLRPVQPFDLSAALRWFEREARGLPYGWLDLLAFLGWRVDGPGMICSSFATGFLRAGGLRVFNVEPITVIAPCDFLQTELLTEVAG